MLVGGEMTCPRCARQDATQRVSFIVRAMSGALSVSEIDRLEANRSRTDLTELAAPQGAKSWEALAKKLQLPQAPYATSAHVSDRTLYIVSASLWILSPVVALNFFPDFAEWYLVFLVPLVATALIIWYSSRRRSQVEKKRAVWGEMQTKWNQMWYCGRDNIVFVPGQAEQASPEEIKRLLAQAR